MNIGFLMYQGLLVLDCMWEFTFMPSYGYCYKCAWEIYLAALEEGTLEYVICSDILETL